MLCAAVVAVLCCCENPEPQPQEPGNVAVESGVGTCVPIMVPDEFIFLSWYELINIYKEPMLDEYKKFATEWRLKMLKEAGFNVYFDYRLNSLEEAEALLKLGDTTSW